ncbi:MAG: universal stress protein [Aeromicrobium sp.]
MKTTIKPVVVGIVDKQPSVLRFAMREAIRAGAPLRVVHAVSMPVQVAEFNVGIDAMSAAREGGQKLLDDAKHFIDKEAESPPVSYVLTTEPAIQALERESATARVLIIGADDLPWYDRMLGGAVAPHVTRHASCAVVVVPEISYPPTATGGVVVTLDGDTSASGPLGFAFEQADARDRTLQVLHAAPPATLTSDVEDIRVNIGAILAGWNESFPDVRVIPTFIFETPEQAIVDATENAELVVVGRPHNRTIAFALARPVAMQVLRRAQCPVAIVPADYQGS